MKASGLKSWRTFSLALAACAALSATVAAGPPPPAAAPAWAFPGAYAVYSVALDGKMSQVRIAVGAVRAGGRVQATIDTGGARSSGLFSFDQPPFPRLNPNAPPNIGTSPRVRHTMSIKVPAGRFSTTELSYPMLTGVARAWFDPQTGILVRLSGPAPFAMLLARSAAAQGFAGSETVELVKTNLPLSPAKPAYLLYGCVGACLFLLLALLALLLGRSRARRAARSPSAPTARAPAIAQIAKLKTMLDAGAITPDGFAAAKGRLLAGAPVAPSAAPPGSGRGYFLAASGLGALAAVAIGIGLFFNARPAHGSPPAMPIPLQKSLTATNEPISPQHGTASMSANTAPPLAAMPQKQPAWAVTRRAPTRIATANHRGRAPAASTAPPRAAARSEIRRRSPATPTQPLAAPVVEPPTVPVPASRPLPVVQPPPPLVPPTRAPSPPVIPPPAPPVAQVLAQGTLIYAALDSAVSTKTAHAGDPVHATVSQPVTAGANVVIPVGSTILGTVLHARRGGFLGGHGELQLRFDSIAVGGRTLVLHATLGSAGSTHVDQQEGTTTSKGAKTGRDAAVGAGAGSALGAIFGSGGDAIKGGAAGAGVGALVGALAAKRDVSLPAGSGITLRLDTPLTVVIVPGH